MNECKVCGNEPDEDGVLHHGRGCYVVSEDGGGETYVNLLPQGLTDALLDLQDARGKADALSGSGNRMAALLSPESKRLAIQIRGWLDPYCWDGRLTPRVAKEITDDLSARLLRSPVVSPCTDCSGTGLIDDRCYCHCASGRALRPVASLAPNAGFVHCADNCECREVPSSLAPTSLADRPECVEAAANEFADVRGGGLAERAYRALRAAEAARPPKGA